MKLSSIVLAAAMSVAGVLASTTVSHAATEANGVCESLETCFYWGPDQSGAVWDTPKGWLADFGGARFVGGGQGSGQLVKNNVASVWENSTLSQGGACVHYNENFRGKWDFVPVNSRRNLVATRNDNASFNIRNSEQDCRAQS
jgi:hypothetical protein